MVNSYFNNIIQVDIYCIRNICYYIKKYKNTTNI